LGIVAGETYSQQSVRLNYGDMILAFSDGATEVCSPTAVQLTPKGFLALAEKTLKELAHPLVLPNFSEALLLGVQHYGGRAGDLHDDVTLLALRRIT